MKKPMRVPPRTLWHLRTTQSTMRSVGAGDRLGGAGGAGGGGGGGISRVLQRIAGEVDRVLDPSAAQSCQHVWIWHDQPRCSRKEGAKINASLAALKECIRAPWQIPARCLESAIAHRSQTVESSGKTQAPTDPSPPLEPYHLTGRPGRRTRSLLPSGRIG